jgi:hypothetical protein
MDPSNFDRITRVLARGVTRRGVFGLAGGLAALKSGRVLGAQLGPPACGQAGAVCTMLSGCCEGFTCVTSTINVNYGVCATGGDGGTVAGTTSLVSPFSEGAEQAVAPAATDTSTTTDPQAEREAEIAERKARKDAHQNKIQLRRDEQRDRQDEKKDDRQLERGPKLQLELFNHGGNGGTETLKVTNLDGQNAVLTRIEPLGSPSDGSPLTTSQFTLAKGESCLFVSGVLSDATDDEFGWLPTPFCSNVDGDGILVRAARSSNSENHDYEIFCDGSSIVRFGVGNGKKRKKQGNRKSRKKSKGKAKGKGRKGK